MTRFRRLPLFPEADAGRVLHSDMLEIRASIGELRQAAGLMLARLETLEYDAWARHGQPAGRMTGAVQGLEGTWTITLLAEWLE